MAEKMSNDQSNPVARHDYWPDEMTQDSVCAKCAFPASAECHQPCDCPPQLDPCPHDAAPSAAPDGANDIILNAEKERTRG